MTAPDPAPAAPVTPAVLAWVLVSLGIALDNGAYAAWPLRLVSAGVLALVAAGALLRARSPAIVEPAAALGVAAGVAVVVPLVLPSGLYGAGEALTWSRSLSVVAALLVAGAVVTPLRASRGLAGLAVATGALAASLMVRASPRPLIDVWFLLTVGADRTAAGHNVFTSCWPGNTDRLTDCVYPYGPLTTVLQLPFRLLLGDVRWSYVGALLLAAGCLWRLGGPRTGPLLAALLLAAPKLTFLVEQAWTEPLLLAALAVMVLATVRGSGRTALVALAVALACKQHVLLLVPLAAWWPAFGPRRAGASVLLAGAATLPWFLADPRAFLDDALFFNLDLPPRRDSLSLFTTALAHGLQPSFVLVALVSLVAVAGAMLLLPRTAAGFALGAALAQGVFDVANKQSFFNHWWFVAGLALLGAAAAAGAATPAAQPAGRGPNIADPVPVRRHSA